MSFLNEQHKTFMMDGMGFLCVNVADVYITNESLFFQSLVILPNSTKIAREFCFLQCKNHKTVCKVSKSINEKLVEEDHYSSRPTSLKEDCLLSSLGLTLLTSLVHSGDPRPCSLLSLVNFDLFDAFTFLSEVGRGPCGSDNGFRG